ncbi:MAG: SET domain-containing protein [Methyloprofundus sp.]|nr:SET domain-containing protein [Methyloprofundus sp.]
MNKLVDTVIKNLKGTRLSKSKIQGIGLFCEHDIEGDFLFGKLTGQILRVEDCAQLKMAYGKTTCRAPFSQFEFNSSSISGEVMIRAFRTHFGYINHSNRPNVCLNLETQEVLSLKDINKGEELFIDYRSDPVLSWYFSGEGWLNG